MRRSNWLLLMGPGAWPTREELEEFQQSIAAPASTFKYYGLGDLWQHSDDPALSSSTRAPREAAGE